MVKILLTPKTEFFITAFLGFTGIHRFLKKEIGLGFLYFFTLGIFYIGWISDAVKAYRRMKVPPIECPKIDDFSCIIRQIPSNKDNYNQHVQSNDHNSSLTPEYHNIDSMDGMEFEKYCVELLQKLGYSQVIRTPGSGDQGVDIIAVKDDIRYAIQCKRYSTDLGNTPIQEVTAGKAFYHCHVAVVLTNSHFTPAAKKLAEANGVLLWNREKLYQMIDQAARLSKSAHTIH